MPVYVILFDAVMLSANLRDTNPQKSACRTRTLGLKHDMGILQSLSIPQLSCEEKQHTTSELQTDIKLNTNTLWEHELRI